MAENNTNDLTGDQFLEAAEKAGLKTSLDRYLQSNVDKKVEEIIKKRDNTEIQKLTERINDLTRLVSQGSREKIVRETLAKVGLNEKFYPFVSGDVPAKIEESCKVLLESVQEHIQAGIDKKLEAGELGAPSKGTPGSAEHRDITAFAKTQNLKEYPQESEGITQ